jgi:hypothetical protein
MHGLSNGIKLREDLMKKIVLISCVSQKRPYRSKAKDLYISALFKKNMEYARRLNPDAIYILSAKYGLLDLETEIEPYNVTLNGLLAREVRDWSSRVIQQLRNVSDIQQDHFIFLAGQNYRKYLVPYLASYDVPMEGLSIGKQLHFLSGSVVKENRPLEKVQQSTKNLVMVPGGTVSKYSRIGEYLSLLPKSQQEITLPFSTLEQIVCEELPNSARRHRAWWSNETAGSHSQARGWLNAGWRVDTVDFYRTQVRFVRSSKVAGL